MTGFQKPECPICGSSAQVVRMASSLTPFERPEHDELDDGNYYCQRCGEDFIPNIARPE